MPLFFAQSTKQKDDVFLALLSAFITRALFKSRSCRDNVCFLCSKIKNEWDHVFLPLLLAVNLGFVQSF